MTAPPPTSIACPTCGAAAVPGDRFCEACGADLPFSEATTAEAPPVDPTVGEAAMSVEMEEPHAPDGPAASALPACVSCGAAGSDIQEGYCGVCGMKQPAPRDHVELSDGAVAGVSDRGRAHPRNEDAFALGLHPDGWVAAVVCDGVSSTVSADVASQTAADAALAALCSSDGPTVEALLAAHRAAQEAVEAVEGQPSSPQVGWPSCTFLAAVVEERTVRVASLGDCRAYWLPHEGAPETLTEDDSWAAEQVASGVLTPEEASVHPMAHTITRWVGRDAEPSWGPRLAELGSTGPGRLVLCTDGLWNYAPTAADVVAAATMTSSASEVAEVPSVLEVARRLVEFALERGGHDNVTVVVIDLVDRPTTAEPSKGPHP